MRQHHAKYIAILAVSILTSANAQAPGGSGFLAQAFAAQAGSKPIHGVVLTASATWTAGSTRENGTAELEANTDGSASLELSLGQASRKDTQTKWDASRICQWTDNKGKSREVKGLNCANSVSWFAPILTTQAALEHQDLFVVSDDGERSVDGQLFHQVSFSRQLRGRSPSATQHLAVATKVTALYDPHTFLPFSVEYPMYPDGGDDRSIPVRIVFSDFRAISGVMIPFHIEKYFNRTLQLTLNVSNAVVN